MPEIVVSARSRDQKGKNVNRRLRAQGLIPGVLYGAKKEAVPVAVSPKEIGSILRSASGENTLFDLDLGGSRRKVILKEFQVEPIKGRLLHADFYEVALDKTLEVDVHVEIQGVPIGVKVQGGVLDIVTRELRVECLPTDIPEKIVVDVSELEMVTEPDVVIVHVVAPRAEEEVAPVAAEAVPAEGAPVAEPEVIKKGKAVAEGAEGEEKPEKPERAERAEKPEKKEKK
ncbi:MAG: 50S ribosomal protein L25 [Acidobacteria bacterium]|nr:MAG: 50S ribosomal protein L25 [Acidobacteriota bacterium]